MIFSHLKRTGNPALVLALVGALAANGCKIHKDDDPQAPMDKTDQGKNTDAGLEDQGTGTDGIMDETQGSAPHEGPDGSVNGETSEPTSSKLDAEGCGGPNAPAVTLVQPESADDLVADPVVTSGLFPVRCRATPAETDEAGRLRADDLIIEATVGDRTLKAEDITRGEEADTYEALFDFGEEVHDSLDVTCYAQDSKGWCSRDKVSSYVDTGPIIEVISPNENDVLSTQFEVRYKLSEAPVKSGDDGAKIASHVVTFGGIELTGAERDGDEYFISVDLEDAALFDVTLVGDQDLVISAQNSRDEPAESEAVIPVTIDVNGPSIEIIDPLDGDARGGGFDVVATIEDDSGIAKNSVTLLIGDEELKMTELPPETPRDPPTWARRVDVSEYGKTVRELTINVIATDLAGNRTTASVIIKLDLMPPLVTLDSPMVMEGFFKDGGFECSDFFDPLGSDSVVDRQVVGTAAEFRARVKDQGNLGFATQGTATFISYVDPDLVELYVSDDIDTPILVDLNNDGICDDINPSVEPTLDNSSSAVVVDFVAVEPDGKPTLIDYTDDDMCVGDLSDSKLEAKPQLCGTSPLTRIIPDFGTTDDVPGIWAKPPVTDITCAGDAWDFQGSIEPGWACVVMRAVDNLGNVGVSAPLRVCFTSEESDGACPAAPFEVVGEDVQLPSCTDGCEPPPSFEDYPQLQSTFWL